MEVPKTSVEKEIFNHGVELAYSENEVRDALKTKRSGRGLHFNQLSELEGDLDVTLAERERGISVPELTGLKEDVAIHRRELAEFDADITQKYEDIRQLGEAIGSLIGRQ